MSPVFVLLLAVGLPCCFANRDWFQPVAIQSPNFPNDYPDYENVSWNISVPAGMKILITFQNFTLEHGSSCGYDKLEIIEGSKNTNYCGSALPPDYISERSSLVIRFVSDRSRTYSGFYLLYRGIERRGHCGGRLSGRAGIITSPGYPSSYQNNQDCSHVITVPAGMQVQLTFEKFSMENSKNCSYDALEIIDGSRKIKYCGTDMPAPFTSRNNTMIVRFRSDFSITDMGFLARFVAFAAPTLPPTVKPICNVHLTAPNGVVTSPGFPANYQNHQNCTTRITAAPGKRIRLAFSSFSLERHSSCRYDYVRIIDGSPSKKYCGAEAPAPMTSKTNELSVIFVSDFSNTAQGFNATYQIIDDAIQNGCNDSLFAPSGKIFSPGYPSNYVNHLNCLTTITVPADKRVRLNFTAFELEPGYMGCPYDFLEVRDGSRAKKYCGSTRSRPSTIYVSNTNKLIFHFKTDHSNVRSGYYATYTTVNAPPFRRLCFHPSLGPPPPKPPSKVNEQNCGKRSSSQSRVIGGVNATKGAWPWQIGMHYQGSSSFFCGGSLISPLWVVTAAHCVSGDSAGDIYVKLGDLNLNANDGTEQKIDVEAIVSHRSYDSSKLNYDIAMLKLRRPAMVNNYVNTVCVPGENETIPVNSTCYITGWGKIKHPGRSHPHLQQASLKVIDSQICQRKLDKTNWGLSMTDKMVCAGVPGTIKSGCHGDSGGPFVCRDASTDKFYLHGAVSWGSPRCNSADAYTVFARVQALRGWIDNVMREN